MFMIVSSYTVLMLSTFMIASGFGLSILIFTMKIAEFNAINIQDYARL
jgi:hypothetical protein